MGEAKAPRAVEKGAGRYCRQCGYDLRASAGRCPECGRGFDPANPRTFRNRPPGVDWRLAWRATWWWAWRVTAGLAVVGVTWGAIVGWMWQGWRAEEREVQWLNARAGIRPLIRQSSAFPELELLLPARFERISDRVTAINGSYVFSDDAMAHISGMWVLEELYVASTPVSDTGLEHLKGLGKLQRLSVGFTAITDAGLAHLAGLNQIEALDLSGTRITDAGLARLVGLRRLRSLRLDNTSLTDAGLTHLAGMGQLQELHLKNTGVTDAGVKKLQVALPRATLWR
jgi:hypothetical protein